ncbi:MAG: alpha/beta fold hydrolase [Ardenticatenaceae bacterium]
MRAMEPAQAGKLRLEGFEISYEAFGDPQAPAVLLLPTRQIVHSRCWKMQIPFLARSFRVITFDSAGNGGGERTEDPAAFAIDCIVDQAIGLLDQLDIAQANVIGWSRGCIYGLWMAARYPERVTRLVLIGKSTNPEQSFAHDPRFWERRESYRGWQKRSAPYWLDQYDEWLDFFFRRLFNEPHSSKAIDDAIGWGLETTPQILVHTTHKPICMPQLGSRQVVKQVRCPVLLLHGGEDRIDPVSASRRLARARPDWELVILEGCGHGPHIRDPVKVNRLLADFFEIPQPKRGTWRRAASRRNRRALFVSSPIGLGHVQRDLAIARELRRLAPELSIEWLAQPPVTGVLERAGETIHPLSERLASESTHWEQSAREHELHCFYAWRNLDEILLANFMLFLAVVRETPYDLWIGDEAWEVDYYLHENPELKSAPFVFLTDFLGWLPMDRSPGSREASLTADYNAEMIEQVARYRRVRDRALYIGDYEDLIPERFGPKLPLIPDWAHEHFTAVGYVLPFDAADYTDTHALRQRLAYDPERPLVIYAVGGTAIGRHLLQKAIAAWPLIHRERPDALCRVVAGPRIDPQSLPVHEGLEVVPYIHDLYEHLAATDLAVVQGGLSTTMELTATRRPFLYFPLKNHVEQCYHVAYRLDRYHAGQRLHYEETSIEELAQAALQTLDTDTSRYRPVATGAAARAAALIAELL